MRATLGNISFDIIKGFESLSTSKEATYSEHAIVDGKPVLQRIGTALDKVSIGIRFHAGFCVPENEIENLEQAQFRGDISALILGNGRVLGEFIIQGISLSYSQTDGDGNITDCNVSLDLTEYYSPNRLDRRKEFAKSNAFALEQNNPQKAVNINVAKSGPAAMGESVTAAAAAGGDFNIEAAKMSAGATPSEGTWSKLKKSANEARKGLENVKSIINSTPGYPVAYPDVLTRADETLDALIDLELAINTKDVSIFTGSMDRFNDSHSEFKKVFTPISALISIKST